MARKSSTKADINYTNIAVFEFSKGSQSNEHLQKGGCYYFMLNMIETLMRKSNVQSERIGISGYKEDVAAYLSALMAVYHYKDIEIDLKASSTDFDTDILPDN